MKKFLLCLVLWATLTVSAAADPLKVVATIGQIADAARNVGGDLVTVKGLMGAGVDPHLYKASEGDVRTLSEADLILYNGLNLEAKMAEIFKNMSRRTRTAAVGESIPPEMLISSTAVQGHHDPHIWFDVQLWTKTVERIRDEFAAMDPENQTTYQENARTYLEKLGKLHGYVSQQAAELPPEQRVLVTAHDAFHYFGRAYGFEVVGLQGISTQSEAGTADIKRLADMIAERRIKAIFIESSVPERNIKAVQEAVKARGWDVVIGGELFSDAMGTDGTFEGTYIGMVTHNINIITNALK